VADIVAAALIGLALIVVFFGEIPRFYLYGIPISIRTAARPFALGMAILALRHWRFGHHPVLSRLAPYVIARDGTDEDALMPTSRPATRALGEWFLVVAGACALVFAATWPQVVRLDAVPDLGDPLFSTWRMAWIAHQLPIDPLHLFDGNTFYPERLTLTYSDPMLLPALMAAPLIWAGVHQVYAYTAVFLSAFVLSGVTMFALVRALTGRRDAAAVAAAMFVLYPYRFEHYSHAELQMTMWMPLALLSLHRTMTFGRARDGVLTGVWLALQTLSSLYYGVFLATFMVPLGVTLWAAKGRPSRPVKMLAAGAVVAAVLTAPVGAAYLANRSVLGERPSDAIMMFSARPGDYLTPHFRSARYGEYSAGGKSERQLFPGLAPLAFAAAGLIPPLNAARLGYLAALAVAFDGSLGLHGVIYPWLHEYGVVYRGLRAPARFSILVGMTLAILSGYAVARLVRPWPRAAWLLTAGALGLVMFDAWPVIEFKRVWRQPPAIYAALPQATQPAVLAEFPAGPFDDFPYIYFSTFHWQHLVNGNSGFFPPSYMAFINATRSFPDDGSLAYLRSRGVQYVAVHGAFYHSPQEWAAVDQAVAAQPALEKVSSALFAGRPSTLYRLKP
jgi:hypothetical protein